METEQYGQEVFDSLVSSFSNVDIWEKILKTMPDREARYQGQSPHCIVFRGIKNLNNNFHHDVPAKSLSIKLLDYHTEQHILITLVRSAFTNMPHRVIGTRGDATIDRVQLNVRILGISDEEARQFNRDKLNIFFKTVGRFYDLNDINLRMSGVLIGKVKF